MARTVPLAIEHLALLPEDHEWVGDVLREWGGCGRVVLVEDQPCGWAVFAPPAFVPGADGLPTSPVSPDAVLLATVYVAEERRGGGLARLLIQGMARDLTRRKVAAVEAFADTRGRTLGADVSVLPVGFYEAVGFRVQRAHSTTPRMRMDLRTAVSWRDEVGQALERIRTAVRPQPAPAPAPERTARPQPRLRPAGPRVR